MEVLHELGQLYLRMGELSFLELFLLMILWASPLVLVHELGHAAMALDLTRGPVLVEVGMGPKLLRLKGRRLEVQVAPWLGAGRCSYEDEAIEPPRREAWIAAGGPLASLIVAFCLLTLALTIDSIAILTGVYLAGLQTVLTTLPIRYGAGFWPQGESDGVAVVRILSGRPRIFSQQVEDDRPERAARPIFFALLGVALVLAFLVSPSVALLLAVMFGGAFLLQRV